MGSRPTELVTQFDRYGPAGLLTDDANHLYWVTIGNDSMTPGGIATIRKDGSAPYRIIADGLLLPRSMTVEGENVYWSEFDTDGALRSCPLSGCETAPAIVSSRLRFSTLLDVIGDRAYWFLSTSGTALPSQGGSADLMECSLDGCGSSLTVLTSEPHGPQGLAVDATHVYWVTVGEKKSVAGEQYSDGAVKRLRRR
jgi:hypothetical protein